MAFDINQMIMPVVSMGGLGILFGASLAYAAKKFAVPVDERATAINSVLPQANCGGCGYPGCMNYAQAVVGGDPVNKCTVGGAPVAARVAEIMGVESVESAERNVAYVHCNGGSKAATDFAYSGILTCTALNMLQGGHKVCKQACLGCGDCVSVCMFDAIHVNDQKVAVVDPEKCTACSLCVEKCPKKIIELVPASQNTHVRCSNNDPGAVARKACEVACIACKLCEKACKYDAIHVDNNLAKIDYKKCVDCKECFKVCPTHAINADETKPSRLEPME